MPKCPEHQKELMVSSTGRANFRPPWKVLRCLEPECKALSGPTCNVGHADTDLKMMPCAPPEGSWGWQYPVAVQYFVCVACGSTVWRFHYELDRQAN